MITIKGNAVVAVGNPVGNLSGCRWQGRFPDLIDYHVGKPQWLPLETPVVTGTVGWGDSLFIDENYLCDKLFIA